MWCGGVAVALADEFFFILPPGQVGVRVLTSGPPTCPTYILLTYTHLPATRARVTRPRQARPNEDRPKVVRGGGGIGGF